MGKIRKAVTAAIILIVFVFIAFYIFKRGPFFFYSILLALTEKSSLWMLHTLKDADGYETNDPIGEGGEK